MEVIVLKVRLKENLQELDEVIQRGRTFEPGERDRLDGIGGWQMPSTTECLSNCSYIVPLEGTVMGLSYDRRVPRSF